MRVAVTLDRPVSLLILVSRLRSSRQIRGQARWLTKSLENQLTKSLARRPAQVVRPSPSGRLLSKRSLSPKPT